VIEADALEMFVDGFRQRLLAMRRPGDELLEAPGIVALQGTADAVRGRVLVYDDRALGVLSGSLPVLYTPVVNVLASAEKCHALLARADEYRPEPCTAMVCDDLAAIPQPRLPATLSLCRIDLSGASGVRLEDAAEAALRADPSAAPVSDVDGFVDYLRSIPNAGYLAAIDANGDVRATAASARYGTYAAVFFVNTDPEWRGQGVGTAMTAAALNAAADAGAGRALLDASALGYSIYERLGFTAVGPNTLFVRNG
jgi:ribosomal protein S18 acetylase RimI-like enzyme